MKKIIFINVIIFCILVYTWSSYEHRKTIVNIEKPINNFSVLEINCGSGYRGGSTIQVEFNNEKYYVGITPNQCKSFNLNKIELYYDKEKNKVFERNELTIRYVAFYLILYLSSCIWLCASIREKYKNRCKKGE